MKNLRFCNALTLLFIFIIVSSPIACGSTTDGNIANTNAVEDFISVTPAPSRESSENPLAIAETGFQALKTLDPEKLIKYTNIELLYYMGNPEKAEENQILEAITALIDNRSESYNSLGIAGSYLAMENVEFYDATPLSEEELTEINAVVTNGDYAVLKDFPDYPYLIEKAYKIHLYFSSLGGL